jgi:DNA invertase Pin-like site-specific DNA recombinase
MRKARRPGHLPWPGGPSSTVDLLRSYLNRGDLLHDLQEAVRQLGEAARAGDTPGRSVTTVPREHGSRRRLGSRLSDEQIRELVAAFEAGTTRLELAERYGIGRTSVAKVLREWRKGGCKDAA